MDKCALITGATRGIGKQIAITLAKQGYNIALNYRKENEELENTKKEIEKIGVQVLAVKGDVANFENCENFVKQVIERFGQIDVLVNNAGINLPRLLVDVKGEKPEYELNEDSFGKMFAVNVKGVFLCAQAVARELVKQGHGVILNMSSESGKEGSQGQSAYSATKRAVDSFTRSWSKELGKYNVRVVACAPGIMEATGLRTTAYNEALAYTRGVKPEDLSTDYSKVIPIGRDGKLDEVGSLVAYLVSDQASYITGTTVNISGGKSRG